MTGCAHSALHPLRQANRTNLDNPVVMQKVDRLLTVFWVSQDLLCITGSIDTNRGDVEGYNGFKNALLSAKQHNLEHEVLTGDEVNARFPGYNLPSNFMVQFCCACLLHWSAWLFKHHDCLMQSIPAVPDCTLCVAVPNLLLLYTQPSFPLTALQPPWLS